MMQFRVIAKQGQAIIVEYNDEGEIKQVLLPKLVVRGRRGGLPIEMLRMGIEVNAQDTDTTNSKQETPRSH